MRPACHVSQNDKPDLAQEFKGLSQDVLAKVLASVITAKGPGYVNITTGSPKTTVTPNSA